MTVGNHFMPFWPFLYPTALVLQETLEGIRRGEGAESWTEVIAHTHFYPDLHGLFYILTHTLWFMGILLKVIALPSLIRACEDPS